MENFTEGVDEFGQPAAGWLLVVSNLKIAGRESESRRSVANHQYFLDYSRLFAHITILLQCLHCFYVYHCLSTLIEGHKILLK